MDTIEHRNFTLQDVSFSELFLGGLDPQLIVDTRGIVLEANRAACYYFGWKSDEIRGQQLFTFITPGYEGYLKELLMSLEKGSRGTAEVEVISRENRAVACELCYHAVEVSHGIVAFIRCNDIQSLKELHRTLDEKELFYRSAERVSRLGSWVYFPQKDQIVWSDQVFNIFGLPASQKAPSFEGYLARLYPPDVPGFMETFQHAMQNIEGYTVKHGIVWPDGTIRQVLARGEFVTDEEGNIVKIVGIVQDITEEEDIRKEIRKSEQRIRFHMDRSPLGYIEWSTSFEVVEWNHAAEEIFGYTREEAIRGEADIIPEDMQEAVGMVVQNLLNDTGGARSLNENLTKSGEQITCDWFNTTLRNEDGEIIGIGSIVQDVTDRKQAKEQLENYARDLEVARDAAESAVRAKSLFLANMSHEIRTPMNGVIGMASILMETDLDEEQAEFVETIVTSGESLLSIINDILDFSKIEAGKIDIEQVPFKISAVVENTLDLLAARAAEKDLDLIYCKSECVPDLVIGDPTRFQQILLNLLGNAIKFTPSGEIEIKVDLKAREGDRAWIEFKVIDSGIGIAKEKQATLFEAFSQVDASITRKYGGTGLGLSISAKLCQLMGGTIAVESVVDQGATFIFSLEVGIPDEEQPALEALELGGLHILVAEPNKKMQQLLGCYLRRMGASVSIVADAESVFETLERESFDMIILESTLGSIQGTEVAERIQQLPGPRTDVILLSWIIERVDSPAIQGRLAKPVHYKSLYNTIHKLTVLQK